MPSPPCPVLSDSDSSTAPSDVDSSEPEPDSDDESDDESEDELALEDEEEQLCMNSMLSYNTLLDDSDQPPVSEEHITDLAEMFVCHNADKVLGIHLIHGHFKIPKNTVMLGSNFESPSLRWAKVTDIDKINPSRVHGHIFALTKHGLCAYELQDGPLSDLSGVDPGFIDGFINYLVKKNLTSLVGLQVLGCSDGSMSELILDQGTVMLESTFVKNTVPTRITGWKFEASGGRPRVCSANETHAAMTSGNQKVSNAGKLFLNWKMSTI